MGVRVDQARHQACTVEVGNIDLERIVQLWQLLADIGDLAGTNQQVTNAQRFGRKQVGVGDQFEHASASLGQALELKRNILASSCRQYPRNFSAMEGRAAGC